MVVFAVLLVWSLSIGGTWIVAKKISFQGTKNGTDFPLLNPRLKTYGLDSPEERDAKLFSTLVPLKDHLLKDLGENKENTAFYVEDLNTGGWIGWKERDPFIAASLLKVPIAVGVMKKVDKGEWTLDTTFQLEGKYKDGNFGELWKVSGGTPLTIKHLIGEMLQKSDNTAANILFDKLTTEERDDVYYHIGVINPEIAENSQPGRPLFSQLSSKDLATMFRALYNATYLTRKSSTYILEVITETKFDDLVTTSIPKDVKVAHKIGNYFNPDPNRPKNYHDCGIVYMPEHPYLYCVMTKNLSPDQAKKVIVGASEKTYFYFEKGDGERK